MKRMSLACTAAIGLLASAPAAAHVQVERTGNPTSVIASTASVPPGTRLVFLSGSTASPIDPAKPDEFGDTGQQTLSILTKMKGTLEGMGLGLGDVVKLTVFLVGVPENEGRMDSAGMNAVFRTFFGTEAQPNKPTRSTVQVAALGRPTTLVEIEAIVAAVP